MTPLGPKWIACQHGLQSIPRQCCNLGALVTPSPRNPPATIRNAGPGASKFGYSVPANTARFNLFFWAVIPRKSSTAAKATPPARWLGTGAPCTFGVDGQRTGHIRLPRGDGASLGSLSVPLLATLGPTLAVKESVPQTFVRSLGPLDGIAGLRLEESSLTQTLPASVPPLIQICLPLTSSLASNGTTPANFSERSWSAGTIDAPDAAGQRQASLQKSPGLDRACGCG